ncbi:hypothetical protein ACFYRY_42020 [Streptomyces sp. NPDC005263]|uniref:hypothetical protein n=1 Tax=Streptomyces sp. NPDC005263 TaxID=3364711 RepID=UPI0036948839
MADRPRHRLTRRQALAVLILTVHGTAWLAVALAWPSLRAVLVCLSSYLAALAALALVLSAGSRWRCADCDTWNGPADSACHCCAGTRRQAARPGGERR